ncbi:MAG TPA: hypothetical protein VGM36_07415 [Rhizomicrobium sp.]
MTKHLCLKTIIPFVAGAAIMSIPPVMQKAFADAASEVVNAQTHAGLAAASTKIDGVHTHLHHTLNCLVGPVGDGFDAKQMNPCAQAGAGAIPDTTDAAKRKSLEAAAAKAREGIAATDFAAAQKDAADTSAMLKAVK